ncbi:MAG: hypothetical protein V3T05_04875 [Myxococcota bacterium]
MDFARLERSRERLARLFFPLVVTTSIVASLLLTAWRLSHTVDDADLAAAAAAVRQSFRPGDLIVVEPRYLVGPRQRLGDLPLWEPLSLSAEDVRPYRRVHLMRVDAIGLDDALVSVLQSIGSEVDVQSFGDVELRTYTLAGGDRVLFDLRSEIDRVRVVARYSDGVESACERWDGNRWVCPRNPGWNFVGRKTLDIDGQPRDCVWMHPLPKGGTLRIELPAVDFGTAITGGYGFAFGSARRARAPVRVRVVRGETEILSFRHPPRRGWERFRAPLPEGGDLRIEVTSENNGASHFCMSFSVVEPAP